MLPLSQESGQEESVSKFKKKYEEENDKNDHKETALTLGNDVGVVSHCCDECLCFLHQLLVPLIRYLTMEPLFIGYETLA